MSQADQKQESQRPPIAEIIRLVDEIIGEEPEPCRHTKARTEQPVFSVRYTKGSCVMSQGSYRPLLMLMPVLALMAPRMDEEPPLPMPDPPRRRPVFGGTVFAAPEPPKPDPHTMLASPSPEVKRKGKGTRRERKARRTRA